MRAILSLKSWLSGVSSDSAASTTLLGHNSEVSTSVNYTLTLSYDSDIEPILYRIYQILNLTDTKLIIY